MLENFNKMLQEAKKGHYAIPHFNINNLEWTKYILEECNKNKTPVILGVSEGAAKYMGGYNVIVGMVKGIIKDLNIEIEVALHLDHGSTFENCKKAIDAGFTSVMIDASKYNIEENIRITKEVVDYAHPRNVTVEAEVGHIGGTEDDITSNISNATLEDCEKLYYSTNIDAIAPALGSVHGFYRSEPNLDFETMKEINEHLPIPLVLHGGSGIEDEKIVKAISCGISKINVNTELQDAWSKGVKEYLKDNNEVYDPRKIIGSGENNLKSKVIEKIKLFKTQ